VSCHIIVLQHKDLRQSAKVLFLLPRPPVLVNRIKHDNESRRIVKPFDWDSPHDPDGLDTYEHPFLSGQQVIETRHATSGGCRGGKTTALA